MSHMLVSKDCTVKFNDNGRVTIYTSLVPNGKISTYKGNEALFLLRQIAAMGDSIPIGAMAEVEKLC